MLNRYAYVILFISIVANSYFKEYRVYCFVITVVFMTLFGHSKSKPKVTYVYEHEPESVSRDGKIGWSPTYRHPDCKNGLIHTIKEGVNTL